MYLFVFVLLLVSILGLYMDAFLIQVGRIAKEQTVIAAVMLDWHDAAFTTAKKSGQTDCILTSGWIEVPTPTCATPIQTVQGNPGYVLPSGYQAGTYQFPSYVFTNAGATYVLTYVKTDQSHLPVAYNLGPPVNSVSLGHTVGEVFQQMQKMNNPPSMYGMITNGRLFTRSVEAGQPVSYALPAVFAPLYGVGYISRVR